MLIQESAYPCVATEEYCLPPRHTRPIVRHGSAAICPTLPFSHYAHATPTSPPVVLTSRASSWSTLAMLTSPSLRPHRCARATPTYSARPCHHCTASHLSNHTVIHSISSSPTTCHRSYHAHAPPHFFYCHMSIPTSLPSTLVARHSLDLFEYLFWVACESYGLCMRVQFHNVSIFFLSKLLHYFSVFDTWAACKWVRSLWWICVPGYLVLPAYLMDLYAFLF
jgi:hypothetical protein